MSGLPAEVERFAKFYASLTDPAARERVLTQVKMQAMSEASEEAFDQDMVRTLGEYLDSEIAVPPELVTPYQVVRGGLNAIIGRSGKGKTVMSLNRLLRWSAGKSLFDDLKDSDGKHVLEPVGGPLKCLIIENEGAAGMFHRQIGIMLNSGDYLSEDDRKLAKENCLIWGDGGYSNLKVDDPAKWNPVRRGIEKHKPDIVFVEPFRSLWAGEENSATEMSAVIDGLVQVAAEFECAVLIAHHEKKGGAGEDDKMSAARGSTVLENFVTVMENFEGVKGVDQRELSWSKSRHAKAPNPVRMEWDEHAWWYRWVPSSEIEEAVLDAIRLHSDGSAMTISQMMEVTGQSRDPLRKLCMKLAESGRLTKLPAVSDGNGTTGYRFALANDDTSANGGLSV
jgi:hypothetical protein